MEVFLIPVGADRYEPYCEVPDEGAEAHEGPPPRGVFRGLVRRFRAMLAAAERERRHALDARAGHGGPRARGWRVRERALRWIAEKIAEQRLLWHLRRQHDAVLVFPEDITEARALEIIRGHLQHEADRHRLWLGVDGIGLIASGLLVLVPGPNVIAYYFGFRLVGHYLSMRGARHGLDRVAWQARPSGPLAELRQAIRLAPPLRDRHLVDIASRLQLERLVSFVQRVALPSA